MSRAEVREVKRREKASKRADARTRKARQTKEKKARREQWFREHPKTAAFLKNRKIRLAAIITLGVLVSSVLSLIALYWVLYLSIPRMDLLNTHLDRVIATDNTFLGQLRAPSGTRVVVFEDATAGCYEFVADILYEPAKGKAEIMTIWGYPYYGFYDFPIFYDDVWQYTPSSVTKLETNHGTEAIIFIVPPVEDVSAIYHKAYTENTKFCGIVPYDTMGNEFIAYYPTTAAFPQGTYPMWMMILSCEDLPEDYELHYGDFVLTAQDIQKGTWAPPSED